MNKEDIVGLGSIGCLAILLLFSVAVGFPILWPLLIVALIGGMAWGGYQNIKKGRHD